MRSVSKELNKNINVFKKKISESNKNDSTNLKDYLESSKNSVFIDTINKHSHSLDEIFRSKRMNMLIENLIIDFSKVSQQLPEKLLMLEESDIHIKERLPEIFWINSGSMRVLVFS